MTSSIWAPLDAELALWESSGLQLQLWLRDDDAIAPTAALDRLETLAERFRLPVLLAVIPLNADNSLGPRLAGSRWLRPCQHGARHINHEPAGTKTGEFGASRSIEAVRDDLAAGRDRLAALLAGSLPVFVPPWNRIALHHAALLPELGFRGLSCFRGSLAGEGTSLCQIDSDLDLIDWKGGRKGRPHDRLAEEAAVLLARKREGGAGAASFGLLLHHRDHDDNVWSFLEQFLARYGDHPAVRRRDPATLFGTEASGHPFQPAGRAAITPAQSLPRSPSSERSSGR